MSNLKDFQQKVKQTVIGQDKAVDVVTATIYKYLLKLYGRDFGLHFNSSTTLLLLGNSGVGKTFIVREAADICGLPFIELNGKAICQEGWAGRSFIQLLEVELLMYPQNLKGGIIFIDEFDKIIVPNFSSHGDNVNHEIQSSILKYVEGSILRLTGTTIDTSKFLFIFAGAFNDLIKKEAAKIGFETEEQKQITLGTLTEALINYGMMPEFAGRIQEYCTLNKLTKKDYKQLLKNKEFTLHKWIELLKKLDINFKYVEKQVIDRAVKANLGVRGLIQSIEELVTKTINTNIDQIDLNKLDPLYVPMKKTDG